MRTLTLSCLVALLCYCVVSQPRTNTPTYILATGRRDPRIYAIDMDAALNPVNNNTSNAIRSRNLVYETRLDGVPIGDPAFIALSGDQCTAFVVNHHGAIDNLAFYQHGERGSVSVMSVPTMLLPKNDNTTQALQYNWDSGYFGATGLLVLPDVLLVAHSEGWLSEDGSNRISIVSRKTGGRVGQIEMPLGHPAHSCPDFPVPFVAPTPPPVVPFAAPDPGFGCWPNPESIAIGTASDNRTYLFSGNAGTYDVSVMDLELALSGEPVVEIANRVPVQVGPFGVKASPDRKFIAVAARERSDVDFFGNTISIIDVDKAVNNQSDAEAARVLVGTDDPGNQTRPFTLEWTPDGTEIVVANFASNTVSIVDVQLALSNDPNAEVARIVVPSPGNPKGTAITADGHYAVVSGGPRQTYSDPPTGVVWIIDLQKRELVATVTGVGNDPYGLTLVEKNCQQAPL